MTISPTTKTRTISNGTTNDAIPVEANFVDLYGNDAAIAAVVNDLTDNPKAVSGVKTFNDGIKTDTISEKTADAGVTMDSVRAKNGMVKVAGTPTEGGEIGYEDNRLTFHNGTEAKTITVSDDLDSLKGYMNGPAPVYASAATITIPAGLRARDSGGTDTLEVASDITLSLATSGAAGLDTGTEAASTWYYPYLIGKTDGTVSAVFSTTNEADTGTITLPTGYTLKRQLPLAVRNDGSSNIIPFIVSSGWPYRPTILTPAISALTGGTATSWTTVSLSNAVPPIAKQAILFTEVRPLASIDGVSGTFSLRENSSSATWYQWVYSASGNAPSVVETIPAGSQSFQYIMTAASSGYWASYASVRGFVVTEVN